MADTAVLPETATRPTNGAPAGARRKVKDLSVGDSILVEDFAGPRAVQAAANVTEGPGNGKLDVKLVGDDSSVETARFDPEEEVTVVGKNDQSRKQANKNRAKAKTQAGSKPKEKGKAAKPEPGKGKTKPGDKATKAASNKKLSALDAAAKLLEGSGEAMTCQEMIKAMAERKLWTSPGGKTPHATLYAALLREIGNKGNASRFRKAGPGKFTLANKK